MISKSLCVIMINEQQRKRLLRFFTQFIHRYKLYASFTPNTNTARSRDDENSKRRFCRVPIFCINTKIDSIYSMNTYTGIFNNLIISEVLKLKKSIKNTLYAKHRLQNTQITFY